MNKSVFRQKSIERVSSPEELNDYIKVANPGIWMFLAAVIILLIGAFIWGILGRLETTVDVAGMAENGTMTVYVKEADMEDVAVGMEINAEEETMTIASVSEIPEELSAETDTYVLHIGNMTAGEWVYLVTAETNLADGIYELEIVTDSVSPISFLMN